MTFKEKSRKKPDNNFTENPDLYSFSDIVDKTCEGLMDCQIKYSIRRLGEMKECLNSLEQELDDFLKMRV